MDHKVSVEVPEDDKPEVISSLRKNPLTLDSYIVPVVFEKADKVKDTREKGKFIGKLGLAIDDSQLACSL